MSHKNYILDKDIPLRIVKNSKSKRLRLSIESSGAVRVSIPNYVPYISGLAFAKSKINWIKSKRVLPEIYKQDQLIGKSHRIKFIKTNSSRISSRIDELNIKIFTPDQISIEDKDVQEIVRKAARKVLLKEANNLLPIRVKDIANKHGFNYRSFSFKFTKSRWGSCDQNKNLTFNPNLMNLPWELIDYVIIHELTHTIHLHHQESFWKDLEKVLPDFHEKRKELKARRSNI